MRELERYVILQVVDTRWREHLENMDYLREGVHLRAMAQKDPLVEYRGEGHTMFQELGFAIHEEVVSLLFHAQIEPNDGDLGLEAGNGAAGRDVLRARVAFGLRRDRGRRDRRRGDGDRDDGREPRRQRRRLGRHDPQQRVVSEEQKLGRNDPCWCGSGKKFKKCHGAPAKSGCAARDHDDFRGFDQTRRGRVVAAAGNPPPPWELSCERSRRPSAGGRSDRRRCRTCRARAPPRPRRRCLLALAFVAVASARDPRAEKLQLNAPRQPCGAGRRSTRRADLSRPGRAHELGLGNSSELPGLPTGLLEVHGHRQGPGCTTRPPRAAALPPSRSTPSPAQATATSGSARSRRWRPASPAHSRSSRPATRRVHIKALSAKTVAARGSATAPRATRSSCASPGRRDPCRSTSTPSSSRRAGRSRCS